MIDFGVAELLDEVDPVSEGCSHCLILLRAVWSRVGMQTQGETSEALKG